MCTFVTDIKPTFSGLLYVIAFLSNMLFLIQ